MTQGEGKVVCVTGASGFIATWLVKLLLERGYTIKATVRDLNDPKKTEHLRELPGASERLHLVKANLLEEGSFDSAVEGCDGVFHTASPFHTRITDPQADMIDPAVKGTLNVLASCAKVPSIKRVVLTSSVAAVSYNKRPQGPDTVIDETWFSDAEHCRALQRWYNLSKTLAEERAWEFAKAHGLDIVTINPAMVIGPILQPTLNTSVEAVLDLVNGAETFNNKSYGWVDVRDVALAHILAFEVPTASGRYCMVEHVAHYSDIVKTLQKLYPDIKLPSKCADDKPYATTYIISKKRANELGINFTPIEKSFVDTVECLREKKLAKF